MPSLALRGIDVGYRAVLDGELVAAQGRAGDFYRVAPTVAARRPGLTLAVFDVLWLDGESLLQETYESRRAHLADLELPAPIASPPSWSGTMAPHLFRVYEEHGVEGIVLKRRDSLYRPGQRCPHWRKIKSALWYERHAERRRPL
jgi:bifunctional non-homologous end joining protein LigD